MFKSVKEQVQKEFKDMAAQSVLFVTDVDKNLMWNTYLKGFRTAKDRQAHNCSKCRKFIRDYGNIVIVVNNELKTIWDFEATDEEYRGPVEALSNLIKKTQIKDKFYTTHGKLGTDVSNGHDHFYLESPSLYVHTREEIITLKVSSSISKYNFKKSLETISMESVQTLLELIDKGKIKKGKRYVSTLNTFLSCQQEYKAMVNKDHYCWLRSSQLTTHVSRIRHTILGKLLLELSKFSDKKV